MWTSILLFSATVFMANCDDQVDILKKYLKVCDRNAADVNDCLVDAIQEALVGPMSDGIKELGVPAVDPYHQKELRVEYKNNQIAVKMTMKNIYVTGLRAAKVHDVRLKADEDNFLLEVDMTTPSVAVKGFYHGEGGWNSLFVNTTGMFSTNMSDLVFTWKLKGKPEKINGETYLKIDSFYMRPDVGEMKSFLTSDNPEARDIIQLGNDFANANWKALYRELLPYAQDNWNRIGIRVANKLFLKVPYDQIFPISS